MSADKAYLDQENLQAAEDLGAQALIPFKSNTAPVGKSEDRYPVWDRSLNSLKSIARNSWNCITNGQLWSVCSR